MAAAAAICAIFELCSPPLSFIVELAKAADDVTWRRGSEPDRILRDAPLTKSLDRIIMIGVRLIRYEHEDDALVGTDEALSMCCYPW